jgi:hypothetical protein
LLCQRRLLCFDRYCEPEDREQEYMSLVMQESTKKRFEGVMNRVVCHFLYLQENEEWEDGVRYETRANDKHKKGIKYSEGNGLQGNDQTTDRFRYDFTRHHRRGDRKNKRGEGYIRCQFFERKSAVNS